MIYLSSLYPVHQFNLDDSENIITNQMQPVTYTNEQFQMLIRKLSMPDKFSDLLNQERTRSEKPISRFSNNTFGSFLKCTSCFSGSESSCKSSRKSLDFQRLPSEGQMQIEMMCESIEKYIFGETSDSFVISRNIIA